MRAAAGDDEIHFGRELPASNAAATWRARQKLGTAARAVLRAAALAAHRRTGYHGARGERRADAVLEEVRFDEPSGPGAPGRLLTARLRPPDGDGPRTAAALVQALRATADAARRYRDTGATEHFDTAVTDGCCAELTESLCHLLRGTEGVRISCCWSATAGAPPGGPPSPAPLRFAPGDLPALEAAGRHYVGSEPSVPVRVTGTVVRLRRAGSKGAGAVRLDVLAGAEVTQVRARLDEAGYRLAVHAHLAGLPLRVSGLLESRGGFRRLSGVHGVAPVSAPEAARERLLKRLRSDLDAFERGLGN